MGCSFSRPSFEYLIYVKTGDRKNAGTNANVSIILHDDQGNSSDKITLHNILRNDFEKGRIDKFPVSKSNLCTLAKLSKIEFWRDDVGLGSDWYVERIMIEKKASNNIFVFPILRWIKPNFRYVIKHLDTSLPQDDDNLERRNLELEHKKAVYELEEKLPGLPAQVT